MTQIMIPNRMKTHLNMNSSFNLSRMKAKITSKNDYLDKLNKS
jgi:hypothetical protein